MGVLGTLFVIALVCYLVRGRYYGYYGYGYNPFGLIIAIIAVILLVGALSHRTYYYARPGYVTCSPYHPCYAPRYGYRGY
jgi:hypothetical protein